jgi:hypothetical protein
VERSPRALGPLTVATWRVRQQTASPPVRSDERGLNGFW